MQLVQFNSRIDENLKKDVRLDVAQCNASNDIVTSVALENLFAQYRTIAARQALYDSMKKKMDGAQKDSHRSKRRVLKRAT